MQHNGSGKALLSHTVKGTSGSKGRHITHGATGLVRAYYAGNVDSRTSLGQLVSDWEREFASHCGYFSLEECPVTLRWKIRLAIGNRLFLMTYLPSPANKTGCRDLRSAENTLNRILSELGLERKAKPVLDLKVYLKERYGAAE